MQGKEWLDLLGWTQEALEDIRFAGFSYIKQGQYRVALKFFEALVFLSGTEQYVYDLQTLGALHLQLGDHLVALNYLEQAIKINATHEPTLLNRAKALFLLGYKKQGLMQTEKLEESEDISISNQARALSLAYG